MSVDTRYKRASALGSGLPFFVSPPSPDGSTDAQDRRQALGLYRFASSASPTPEQPGRQVRLRRAGTYRLGRGR